jgi:hypothetical protein
LELITINLCNLEPAGAGRREVTQGQRWVDRVGLSLLLVVLFFAIFYRWPRLVLLFYFPSFVPFAGILAYYARDLYQRSTRKVVVEISFVHVLFLIAAGYAWKTFPIISQRVDWAFLLALCIVFVETRAVALLLRFSRPKT